MKNPRTVRSLLLAVALVTSILTLPEVSPAQVSGNVNWNGWTFAYEVSGNLDGLSIKGVKFQDLPFIYKLSFPVVRVFYDNNTCGPFVDRLGGTLSPIPWAGNATVAKREFTLNGRQWYEIGIRDIIGNYDLYQVYYFSADGILDAHIYSKGLQCVVDHVHYPSWRIDFDIGDSSNDQIQRNTGAGYETKLNEFNANATEAIDHGWRVRDSVTGNFVDVLPGFTDFTIPNQTTVPATSYANHTVFGRLYKGSEDTGWTYGPNTQVPYNNGEPIGNHDIVFWYEGYLPHSAADGSNLWHSTGLRLAVNGGLLPPPPPPPPGGGTQTFTNAIAISIPDGSASPYPSSIAVGGMSGVISKVSVRLNGLRHTHPDDIDILLVGPGGQRVILMSDAGSWRDVVNVNLTFDSAIVTALPDSAQISSGTYRPTNYNGNDGATDSFSAPAPTGPFGTSLNAFNGTSPNGSWNLFVRDDEGLDVGSIASGWALTITTN
jgi:subtilisin-like proprotein convertase family protein